MTTQADLPLPPVPASRVLTHQQVTALHGRLTEDLCAGNPRIAAQLQALQAAGGFRAALAAIYATATPDEQRLIRTVRALAQLALDAEAHAARQPSRQSVVTIGRPTLAEVVGAAAPISEP